MIITGTILHYNQERGFGFILENGTKRQHFFHVSHCDFLPAVGLQVNFQIGQGKKGVAAVNVTQAVAQ
jgi:cold shock protein